MKKFDYIITDSEGIHARPAGLLVKKANEYTSAVKIGKGEKFVDAKKIFGIMGLCIKKGEEIIVTADGDDEEAAITGMETFLKENL